MKAETIAQVRCEHCGTVLSEPRFRYCAECRAEALERGIVPSELSHETELDFFMPDALQLAKAKGLISLLQAEAGKKLPAEGEDLDPPDVAEELIRTYYPKTLARLVRAAETAGAMRVIRHVVSELARRHDEHLLHLQQLLAAADQIPNGPDIRRERILRARLLEELHANVRAFAEAEKLAELPELPERADDLVLEHAGRRLRKDGEE